MTNEELHELKKLAEQTKPFTCDEPFSERTREIEARAQKNQDFFCAATTLVPKIIDELLELRIRCTVAPVI